MNKGKTILEHDYDILRRMQDILAKRFFLYHNSIEGEKIHPDDTAHLSDIAGRIGFLVNVSVGVEKAVRLEQRLAKIEKRMTDEEKYSMMRLFEDPIEMQAKYR